MTSIIFASVPIHGHVTPLLPLAAELVARLTRAEASALQLQVGHLVWVVPTRTLPSEEEFPALAV